MEDKDLHHIIKKLTGSISLEESKELEAWLDIDDHLRQYQEIKEVWELTGKIDPSPALDLDKEWEAIRSKHTLEKNYSARWSHKLKIAASVSLLAAAAFLVIQFIANNDDFITVGYNDIKDQPVLLQDGSKIWLNKGSSLTYKELLGTNKRLVTLNGEGYFEIAKDVDRPFTVTAEEVKVTVLGTIFNLSAYKDQSAVTVDLLEGKVKVSTAKNDVAPVILNQGEQAIFDKFDGTLAVYASINSNILSWKTRQLIFDETSFSLVIKTLEKYFNREIQIINEAILNCSFTGTFNDPTLDEVLEVIGYSMELEINNSNSIIEINGSGCQ